MPLAKQIPQRCNQKCPRAAGWIDDRDLCKRIAKLLDCGLPRKIMLGPATSDLQLCDSSPKRFFHNPFDDPLWRIIDTIRFALGQLVERKPSLGFRFQYFELGDRLLEDSTEG